MMADGNMAESNSGKDSWLEAELRAQLRPVSAPAGLWTKIQSPGAVRRADSGPTRLLWPVIAVLMLLASVDLLWEFSKARGGLRQTTQPNPAELAALAASPEACDLYSSDPARLQKWVKSRSGIEIEIPAHSSAVRITGARVATVRGTMVASLKFEAANDRSERGTVLVWKSGKSPVSRHVASMGVFGSRGASPEMVSWSQGENVFAAVAAEGASAREACLLCHPEGTHGI